jgi:hypothetical protein
MMLDKIVAAKNKRLADQKNTCLGGYQIKA